MPERHRFLVHALERKRRLPVGWLGPRRGVFEAGEDDGGDVLDRDEEEGPAVLLAPAYFSAQQALLHLSDVELAEQVVVEVEPFSRRRRLALSSLRRVHALAPVGVGGSVVELPRPFQELEESLVGVLDLAEDAVEVDVEALGAPADPLDEEVHPVGGDSPPLRVEASLLGR